MFAHEALKLDLELSRSLCPRPRSVLSLVLSCSDAVLNGLFLFLFIFSVLRFIFIFIFLVLLGDWRSKSAYFVEGQWVCFSELANWVCVRCTSEEKCPWIVFWSFTRLGVDILFFLFMVVLLDSVFPDLRRFGFGGRQKREDFVFAASRISQRS